MGQHFIPLDALKALKVKDPFYADGSVRVTVQGQALITDEQWTDIVHWLACMSKVLRDLTNGTKQATEGYFPDTPTTMLFEVAGDRLTWTVRGVQTRAATLERVPALRLLVREYKLCFEHMKVLNPSCIADYNVSLAYMSRFKQL